jgi:hypothetical protein
MPPTAVSVPASTPVIDVHVHVVLDDGVTLAEGREAVEAANIAYKPIGIRVIASFTTASMHSNDTNELFSELKGLFGGVRPPWAHAVYLLTKRDMSNSTAGENVAGQGDCNGGIRYDDGAFFAGEIEDQAPLEVGPIRLWEDLNGKVFGHELAHLFGAEHHYSNCAEATPTERESDPCTLMFPDIAFAQLKFSTVDAAVVRGNALTYLKPVTATPPPDGSRTVPPPPLTSCNLHAYEDPAGDVTGDPSPVSPGNADADLLAGFFDVSEAGVSFRWKVVDLDGDLGPTAHKVRYALRIDAPRPLQIQVSWDGSSAPSAMAIDGAGQLMTRDLKAKVSPGPGGIVEVALPLEKLGLDGGNIFLNEIYADTVFAAEALGADLVRVDYDTAQPSIPAVRPGACG